MIYNIHLLRVVAALAVVYSHIASDAGLDLPFEFGSLGVDIFFVISGFIIAYIGNKKPQAFFVRRLIRIVPFYWSASFVVFGIAWVFPHLLRQTRADFLQLLHSLFFIPYQSSAGMYPTLILGWTLNYEMYFYALFAVSLSLSRRRAPFVCSLLLAIIMGTISAFGADSAALRFYASPITFEFIYGIAAYYLTEWIQPRTSFLARRGWTKWALIAVGIFALACLVAQDATGRPSVPRHIGKGVPAFVLVFAAILLERVHRVATENRVVFLMGESSYILYLTHPYVIYGITRLVITSVAGWSGIAITGLVVFFLIVPSVLAVAIHLWFEKPLMDFLRRALVRS